MIRMTTMMDPQITFAFEIAYGSDPLNPQSTANARTPLI